MAVEYLTSSVVDLSQIVDVKTMAVMPHLVISYMLYKSIDKADELACRNNVVHPMFMPTEFEALVK